MFPFEFLVPFGGTLPEMDTILYIYQWGGGGAGMTLFTCPLAASEYYPITHASFIRRSQAVSHPSTNRPPPPVGMGAGVSNMVRPQAFC